MSTHDHFTSAKFSSLLNQPDTNGHFIKEFCKGPHVSDEISKRCEELHNISFENASNTIAISTQSFSVSQNQK
jgi:hypothetical protein